MSGADETPSTGDEEQDQEQPTPFGPGGYLPQRAAARARKIVLRAPLGLQWMIAAIVAGVAVVVAGIFLLTGGDGPGGDYEPWGPVADLSSGSGGYDPSSDVLLVPGLGRIRAFPAGNATLQLCTRDLETRQEITPQLEQAGRVYSVTGRALDGGPSIGEHPTVVHEGILYVDATRTLEPVPGSDDGAKIICDEAYR